MQLWESIEDVGKAQSLTLNQGSFNGDKRKKNWKASKALKEPLTPLVLQDIVGQILQKEMVTVRTEHVWGKKYSMQTKSTITVNVSGN